MAVFLFVNAIMSGRPIRLFNHGKMRRDLTCIDDVARVVSKLIDRVPRMTRLPQMRRLRSTMWATTIRKS